MVSWARWLSVRLWTNCGLESGCSHLNLRLRTCFKQGVPLHSGHYRVWIHSVTCTWDEKNILSNAPYRNVLASQLNYFVSLDKWLNFRSWNKCGLDKACSHLNFRLRASFRQGVNLHLGYYRVWIIPETRTWHDKNIQSNATYK